jgi:hypothetical protein
LSEGVVYQNKDVLLKILSKNYKDKTFNAYGLDLPPIKQLLPTNLPVLQLNEKNLDNVFLLQDDSILILEYESSPNRKTILKYGHYAFRVAETYFDKNLHKIIIAVIYSGDVEKAPAVLDLDCIKLSLKQVFLAKFNGNKLYKDLKTKIDNKEPLTETDVMQLIILPLTQKDNKQKFIEKTVTLAQKIPDEETQSFIVAGILAATDKFIDKIYSTKVKGWLEMTKVGRLFEEEKLEYAQKELKKEKQNIARKMLSKGIDILTIMEITLLSKAEILSLQSEPAEN